MIFRFVIYGLVGLLMEVVWTGIMSILKKDPKLTCNTSVWMFPIYGLVVIFEPVMSVLISLPLLVRGVTYVSCIFLAEYLTGFAIKKTVGVCPWDYTGSRFSVQGLIRLDYAPVWFAAGMIFEQVYRYLVAVG